MEQGIREQLELNDTRQETLHTTIALKKDTKQRLDNSRTPGQCYNGFISELIEYWERYRIGSSLCGPERPISQFLER